MYQNPPPPQHNSGGGEGGGDAAVPAIANSYMAAYKAALANAP
jgi:hypothetical protein